MIKFTFIDNAITEDDAAWYSRVNRGIATRAVLRVEDTGENYRKTDYVVFGMDRRCTGKAMDRDKDTCIYIGFSRTYLVRKSDGAILSDNFNA